MTINKSQGQSLNLIDINLKTFSFSHNQFYMTLFKVTNICRHISLFNKDKKRKK